MKRSLFRIAAVCIGVSLVLALAHRISVSAIQGWDPNAFANQDTLQFLTVEPGEGEHWSTVWVAVVDGQLYVRLGDRAAGRIERNTTSPFVKVKIADQQFDHVKVEPVQDMADKVAAVMAEKYWFDKIVRHMSHPLTARLTAEESAPSH
jgi:hypothetical protein